MWKSKRDKPKWIVVGEVAATWGNRGEIKIIPHTDFPERFKQMEAVRLFLPEVEEPEALIPLESCREHKDGLLLKLKGVDSIDEAEKLRGMLIKVSEKELMPLPPGRYYIFQIIGLECQTDSGEKLGVVTDVLSTGANDVYVVKPYPGVSKQREVLIPAIPQVVKDIRPEEGLMIIEPMDGLLE